MNTEAETRVMPLQAKGHPGPHGDQKLEEARKDPFLAASEGAQTYKHFDFRLPASEL